MNLCRLVEPLDLFTQFGNDVQRHGEQALAGKMKRTLIGKEMVKLDMLCLDAKHILEWAAVGLDFARRYGQTIWDLCGNEGSNLFGPRADETFARLWMLQGNIKVHTARPTPGVVPLANYSPALANYDVHMLPSAERLLIPGTNILLNGFGRLVEVIHSLRVPKKITMIGVNESRHHWVLKHGEDLRNGKLWTIHQGLVWKPHAAV
ncbi:hypothetical protein BC832DRAFT_228223 [Gaertneriomyces semiglobifer]|nr:hypothetical protein BC832DRAFT_228223 [Gaertneriomyces semiglobifer]